MDELLQALAAAGYRVHIVPEKLGGKEYIVSILTNAYLTGEKIHELWEARGNSVHEALLAAGFKLQQHMRPVYENYLVLSDAFNWNVDEPAAQL